MGFNSGFKGLNGHTRFLLPVGLQFCSILGNLLQDIVLISCNHFFHIPVFCPKVGLYLVLLQTLCLFYNLSKSTLLFF